MDLSFLQTREGIALASLAVTVFFGVLGYATGWFQWLWPKRQDPPPAITQNSSTEVNVAVAPKVEVAPKIEVSLTIDAYQSLLERERDNLQAQLREADRETGALSERIAAYEAKLANLETAFADAKAVIEGLENTLSRYGNDLPEGLAEAAEAALHQNPPDFDGAERLLTEITDLQEQRLTVQQDQLEMEKEKTATFWFQRGKVAEEQIRWLDAAEHYKRAATLAPDYDRLEKAGTFLWRAGRSGEAVRFDEDLVALSKREHGEEAAETATALNNLAESYRALGHYKEAEPLFRQAIKIGEATIGTTHPAYAIRLNNLAGLLQDMGRYEEAEPLYRQAIEIDEAAIGTAHPDYTIHLNNLANLLQEMGRYEEAEPLYRQAIEIDEATIGTAHPEYAVHLNNLALLLKAIGRYEEAEPLYRKAMEITGESIGTAHPAYAIRLGNLAGLLIALGRLEEAEPLRRDEYRIMREVHGEKHPHVGIATSNLAKLLQETGQYEEAEPLFDQAVSILEDQLGAEHPTTIKVNANREALRAARTAAGR